MPPKLRSKAGSSSSKFITSPNKSHKPTKSLTPGPPPASSPSATTNTNTASPYPALNSRPLRLSYRISRGETGVLTFEPYKSLLLPLWRFRTVAIARQSSSDLWAKFLEFDEVGDFVGMDMARKFIQMGMTRAKRYANYKGGRKYVKDKEDGRVREKGREFEGREEKERASEVFREVWERCKAHEGYREKKEAWMKEKREWEKERKEEGVEGDELG